MARESFGQNTIGQYSALIRSYLAEEPKEKSAEFAEQAARALWLEQRYFENMARAMGAKKD